MTPAGRLRILLVAGWIVACGCQPKQKPPPPPDSGGSGDKTATGYRADPDMGVLAGEWRAADGKSYRFAGTSLMLTRPGAAVEPWAYSLDSRERPKRITLKRPDGTTTNGIYDVGGKRLRVCVATDGGDAPPVFTATPTTELWELNRAN
jgi:uncharacterized protein (TIGR03067 family)